jgi:AcrR family transcriptional regulator
MLPKQQMQYPEDVMNESCPQIVDPRIRRTRQLLQLALEKLLTTKEFDKISVQDISEAATVNRATFYDHYPDKFALLNCLVATRFQDLLAARGVGFDGSCSSALKALALGLCDYLAEQRHLEPPMESAVIGVVRGIILNGSKSHPSSGHVSVEMIASAISWAMYGAALEWLRTPNRAPSEDFAETLVTLVSPIFPSAPHESGAIHAS